VLDGIFSFVYDMEKNTRSISLKSPNILSRAVFLIGYLGLQSLQLHGEFVIGYLGLQRLQLHGELLFLFFNVQCLY
jgi:hypothetical protein